MRIAIAADHRGFALKEALKSALVARGHELVDVGAPTLEAGDDYPDYAYPAALLVSTGDVDRAILICGSGAGMVITANKVTGVRAIEGYAVAHVKAARRDDDANALALAADELDSSAALEIVEAFLAASYDDSARRERRLDEIAEVEHNARTETSHE